jgi:sigma-E factor negative regulatory protein RseA
VNVMTNPSDERISALLDGELEGHEQQTTLDGLLADAETRKAWGRYHLISESLRGNLPDGIEHGFSTRVMQALEDEPTVLAPKPRASWGQRAAGLAVAASVAAVAVLGVQFMYQQDGQAPVAQLAQQSTPTVSNSRKNFELAGIRPNVQTVTQTLDAANNAPRILRSYSPRLNKYLVDHNQQAPRVVQGVVPFARIVAYPNSHRTFMQAQK